jgi:hypothetical protein
VTRVLIAVSARKHSDNHKVSNAIGGHIKCLLLVCDTCGREVIQSQGQGHTHQTFCDGHFDCDKCNKLFADIQCLNEHNAKEHGICFTNVTYVRNLKQEKQLVLVISVVSAMPSLKLPLNLKIM